MLKNNKYNLFLTILLVIIILVLLALGTLGIIKLIQRKKTTKEKAELFAALDTSISNGEDNNINENLISDAPIINSVEDSNVFSGNNNAVQKKVYYENFVVLGYIEIPKTSVQEPILEEVTQKSLDSGVAVIYPSNAILNREGNVVILGHNYRNGTFFSNNKKLVTGDKLYIKDTSGKKLTYVIYEIFQTTPEDATFYNRNTNGATEITLSTCSDDGKSRLIILAKAE